MAKSFRRVVTAHDQNGISIVASNETLTPRRIPSGAADFQLVWTTPTVPADNNDGRDGAWLASIISSGGDFHSCRS
jgi:hypothetical protein